MRNCRIPSRGHLYCVGLRIHTLSTHDFHSSIPRRLKAVSKSYQLFKMSSYVTISSDLY